MEYDLQVEHAADDRPRSMRDACVSTTSAVRQEKGKYPPGECTPYPLEAKPSLGIKPCLAARNHEQNTARGDGSGHLRHDVRKQFRGGESLSNGQPYGHRMTPLTACFETSQT